MRKREKERKIVRETKIQTGRVRRGEGERESVEYH